MNNSIPLETVDEIGSTSEALKARAAGSGHDVALLARRQTGGHGRMGRPWHSIDGNLHLSVLLHLPTLQWPGHWSILAAVVLADAVRRYVPDPGALRLKWPNDVLLHGGKLAGVLLEAGVDESPWLVIGFGVNLAAAPPDLGRPVACLASVCAAPAPEAFAARLLDALQNWRARYGRDGFAPIQSAWLAAGPAPGDRIVAGVGKQRVQGAFHGLGHDGTLLLDGPDGPLAITAGEVE